MFVFFLALVAGCIINLSIGNMCGWFYAFWGIIIGDISYDWGFKHKK